ncbi:serine hydrolase domain-containing protein [Streptococcus halotolerans]|uniref:serine hydrolase domain-containing protein n=1 Tax=Streptococcus halotolerans TaxID=1814128 RepID=UPI000786B321|nr:serine hydrolase [Streptococcus halotolerans]
MTKWEIIQRHIQDAVDNQVITGAAIHIVKDGETVLNAGFGQDKRDSIYRIYSMTKVVTAVAIYKLIEEGRLRITDCLADYLPAFENHVFYNKNGELALGRKITIKDLLNMTSGMPYPGEDSQSAIRMKEFEQEIVLKMRNGTRYSTKELMNLVAAVPGEFEAGTEWSYGISADILGGVIEVVTGQTLSQFFEEHIFQPLGMYDTGFFVPEKKLDRISAITRRHPEFQYVDTFDRKALETDVTDYLTLPFVYDVNTVEPQFLSGGGGLYSTTQDFSQLAQCLLNFGRYAEGQLLQEDTIKEMTQLPTEGAFYSAVHEKAVGNGIPGYSYHNLLRILTHPDEAKVLGVDGNVGEFGWDGAGGNFVVIDPIDNISVVFMMQDLHAAEPILRRNIYRTIFQ